MKCLIPFIMCLAIPTYANTKYSDEAIEKARAMMESSGYEVADPNTVAIIEALELLNANSIKLRKSQPSITCKFLVSIALDGSVSMNTKKENVEKRCQEAFRSLEKAKNIKLPEPRAYEAIQIGVQVAK